MNTQRNFKIYRQEQNANDFGLNYFENGHMLQVVYDIYLNDILIKRHISTKTDKTLSATIRIDIDGSIIDINFHQNKNKKFPIIKENIILSLN
jgi:hypothetical protein